MRTTLLGLFLAAALVGLFLVGTMVAVNMFVSGKGTTGEVLLISFLIGFACARTLAWLSARGHHVNGP